MAAATAPQQGTVKANPAHNTERDSEVLRKAMKGFGTDEKAIIDILSHRSNQQRQEMKLMFKTMYGRDLNKDFKSELSGKLETIVLGLMMTPADYDATLCRDAIKGAGTDEGCLIEILCTRNNRQTNELKDAYKKLFKKDLEKDLMSDTSGHFRKLMVSLSSGGRREDGVVDIAKAQADAQGIHSAGEKKWGTDESKFNQILCSQNFDQLRAVFTEYRKISNRTIEQSIKSEMSGDLEDGMLAVVKTVQNTPGFFAERLYKSMKGLGTDDRTLMRIVVTRCEVDMVQIKQEFQRTYSKSLESFIADDCSGDYKKILIALVSGN